MLKVCGPELKARTRQRGFSLLELVIAGLLILLLATVSYRQYMNLVVDAERAAFSGIRGWLQAGVNLAMSDAIGNRDRSALVELQGSNPMQLLEGVLSLPSNYLGELSGAAVSQAPAGNWYFDLDQGVLYYRFRYREAMSGFALADDDRVGFELKSLGSAADNRISRIQLSPVGFQERDPNSAAP